MNHDDVLKDRDSLRLRVAELESTLVRLRETERALGESEAQYRSLFEDSPASLWVEDFSEVKFYVEELAASGVRDIRSHLSLHPDEVWQCWHRVKVLDVNQASLDLSEAADKAELISRFHSVLCRDALDAVMEQVVAISRGETAFRTESVNCTLTGDMRQIILKWNVAPGHEDTYGRVLVSAVDITDRKRAEEALKESEERYRNLVELSPDGVFVSIDNYVVFSNQSMADIAGLEHPDQLNGQVVTDFVHPDFRAAISERMEELLERRIPAPPMAQKIIHRDGNARDIEVAAAPIRYQGHMAYQAIVRDISDRRKMERSLIESEERYRSIVERSNLGIFVSSVEGFILHANEQMARMTGYGRVEDVVGIRAGSLYAYASDRARLLKELLEKGSVQDFEVLALKKDGTPHWISLSAVMQRDGNGNPSEIHGMAEDITDRKNATERMKAALQEKEVLLREIHHRVKNNLAVVSSLLGLQSRHAKDEYHHGMFIESQDRIRSMALAHEKLYQSQNLSAINSKDFLTSLVQHLFAGLGRIGSDVHLQTRIAEVDLDLETAVTLGFIVNELVTNALKYAFPDGHAGTVSLMLREIDDSTLELRVADDGIGLPEEVNIEKANTLGLDLVKIFSRQLRAHLEVGRECGTEIILRFTRKQ